MAKKMRSVTSIAGAIKRVLKKEGVYSPTYDRLIGDLAEVTYLKAIAFNDATNGYKDADDDEDKITLQAEDRGGRSVVYEFSREGDRRYKINPAYTIYLELVQMSLKLLSELCMTAKSSNSIQEDDVDRITKGVEAILE